MKRFLQMLVIVTIVAALAMGMLLSTTASPTAGTHMCPKVGWNDRAIPCAIAFMQASVILIKPMVGWNS